MVEATAMMLFPLAADYGLATEASRTKQSPLLMNPRHIHSLRPVAIGQRFGNRVGSNWIIVAQLECVPCSPLAFY